MSAGGVFKLIANDGKADRMIMATELLNQRIKDIMCMRAKMRRPNGSFVDPTPTLVDIERTHILNTKGIKSRYEKYVRLVNIYLR